MQHAVNRTHEAYALGYYHGRTLGNAHAPNPTRTLELIEDFYRMGYTRGLKDQYANQPIQPRIDLSINKG